MKKGKRYNKNKPPMSLIPHESLEQIAEVLAAGASKYGKYNWINSLSYIETLDAALRHIGKFNSGEDLDPEFKTHHLANAATNLIFLLYFEKHKERYKKFDDRGFKRKK